MSGPLDFEPQRRPEQGPRDRGQSTDAPREPITPPVAQETISTGRYTWFVGALALVIVLYITFNTISSDGPGSRGPAVGRPAPPFAAPLAAGGLDGFANLAVRASDKIKTAACDVHIDGALNACELWRVTPVAIVFFVTASDACVKQVDAADRIATSVPGVRVVAVALRAKHKKARQFARDHGWKAIDVVYDEDGRMANAYALAVCPQITYVRKGGRVAGTLVGSVSAPVLAQQFAALAAGRPIDIKAK